MGLLYGFYLLRNFNYDIINKYYFLKIKMIKRDEKWLLTEYTIDILKEFLIL
jgi:hypothetical protein